MKTFQERVDTLKKTFASLKGEKERYDYLMDLGRGLPKYPDSMKGPEHIVPGCQSLLYLGAGLEDGKLFFKVESEALISKGLAALLIEVYSGLSPQEMLEHPPLFLKELGILASLSPGRSNGLAQMHLRMKQEALKYLSLKEKTRII